MFIDYILAYIVSLVLCRLFLGINGISEDIELIFLLCIANFICLSVFIIIISSLLFEHNNKKDRKIAINNTKKYIQWLWL